MVERSVTEGTRMEGHQQCKFPLVGSDGWTKAECSISGKVIWGGYSFCCRCSFARKCGKLVTQLSFCTQKLQGLVLMEVWGHFFPADNSGLHLCQLCHLHALNVLLNLILLGLEYLIILTIHFALGMNGSLLLIIVIWILRLSSSRFNLL